MGAAASFLITEEDALAAGKSQQEIDSWKKQNKTLLAVCGDGGMFTGLVSR